MFRKPLGLRGRAHCRVVKRLCDTAITRARRLVVLVGTRRAIQMAVENDRVARRYSGLVWQLSKLLKAQ